MRRSGGLPPSCSGRRTARRDRLRHEITYGKADVKVYRTDAEALTGITPIPESPFTGRGNTLTAAEIEVVVRGEVFLDAYTKGDNRLVVATDTMKNFMHAVSLRARARTLEEWLLEVGTAFLDTYPHMERLTMLGRELPFPAAVVPAGDGDGFEASDRLFSRDRCDHGSARLDLARHDDGSVHITDHESGRRDLQLIKITGSAFADFARDEHTTLPERRDRPLYIWCDIGWRYADASHAVLADPARYVAGEQVADLAVGLPRVRQPVHPAPRQRDRDADAGALAAAGRGELRRAEPPLGPGRRVERGSAHQDLQRSPPAVRPHRAETAAGRLTRCPARRAVTEPTIGVDISTFSRIGIVVRGMRPTFRFHVGTRRAPGRRARRRETEMSLIAVVAGPLCSEPPNYRTESSSIRSLGSVRPGISFDAVSPMRTAPIRS